MKLIAHILAASLFLAPVVGHAAESSGAVPVIEMTAVDFNLDQMPWMTDAARSYMRDRIAEYKEGKILGYVLVVSPNQIWDYRGSYSTSPIASLEELARPALEGCEYYNFEPCRIVSINGKSTARPDGSYAQQPRMLNYDPTTFNFRRIPLIAEQDRVVARTYRDAPMPKAFFFNTNGNWSWKNADTDANAIAEAKKACEGDPVVATCMMYAFNNTVVWEQPR
ncbi:MAG: hypothetical protein DI533_02855 [Cereibacter sphaeroides]|uniref:DUF4189 domain-containing protein n=1 Tax=Cereibacter sphaeroides TaxID=1063 RepID=A0A2W5TUB7_CERSP|nr:MAG: hypothetical protein DI533_02855 [Cereibacter sphaeroides]